MQLELFYDSPFSVRLRFEAALDLLYELHWKHLPSASKTRAHFKRLKIFFKDRYIDEISKIDVEDFRRWLEAMGLKENTINKAHTIIIVLFNKIYEWKEIGTVKGIDFKKIPTPLRNPGSQVPKVNEMQFARNVGWAKKLVYGLIKVAIELGDLDFAEIIEMLYLTKLRPGDFFNMTEKNMDLARMILSGIQNKSITTKNPSGLPYLVALTPHMVNILKRRVEMTPPGKPIFRKTNLQKRWKLIRINADAMHVQLWDLRHAAATLELDNGVDSKTVSEGLGHTTERMLPVYARRNLAHRRRAQEILENKETEIIS